MYKPLLLSSIHDALVTYDTLLYIIIKISTCTCNAEGNTLTHDVRDLMQNKVR